MSDRRALALDVLRGFALLGILFGNLTWFTGWAVLSSETRASFDTAPFDAVVSWSIHFLVDGKFYGVFSLLFGAGFAILWDRAEKRGEKPTARLLGRHTVLLLLGLVHASLLWFGDIVSLYAIVGFALILFARVPQRRILVWASAMLAAPILFAWIWLYIPTGEAGYGPGALLPAFGEGTYVEALKANWGFLKERWFLAVYSGRFFKLLGLFLLGVWAARQGLALESSRHLATLRKLRVWGLAIGIPSNIALAIFITHVPDRPPTVLAFVRTAVDAVAVPSLAVGYCATILILLEKDPWRHWLGWLSLPGRMTFTNYVMQTAIGIFIFYGYGLGHSGELGAVWIVPLSIGIFLAQAGFSAAWLRTFRQGPLEWLWRRMTGIT